jgi:group I intron endonuclease
VGIIYKVTNKLNGKIYIGQTTQTLKRRIASHYWTHQTTRFALALKKYSRDAFTWKIIDRADSIAELNTMETFWISHFDSTNREIGYNINPTGDGTGPRPLEVKAKISHTKMGYPGTMNGRKHSPEAIAKIVASKKGKKRNPMTEGAHRHASEARKGKKKSLETRQRMSAALKRYWAKKHELEEAAEAEREEAKEEAVG